MNAEDFDQTSNREEDISMVLDLAKARRQKASVPVGASSNLDAKIPKTSDVAASPDSILPKTSDVAANLDSILPKTSDVAASLDSILPKPSRIDAPTLTHDTESTLNAGF